MIFFLNIFFVVSFALFTNSPAQNNHPTLTHLNKQTVDSREMETSILKIMEQGGIPGLSCAIINDSLLVYEHGFGRRRQDSSLTVDAQTVFNAASLSKTVFAWLVMLLSQEGAIDLDEPLQTYLEKPIAQYANYSGLSDDERVNDITAHIVLSHSTGFPNWRFLTDDGQLKFLFDPGSRFSYSGEGIQLLQMVIEKITGKGLQELAQTRIFEPFGMLRTSYVWQDRFEGNYTFPHDKYERAKPLRRRQDAEAAGSMQTTAGDYARFLQGLLQARGKLKIAVDEMFSAQIGISSQRMFGPGAWNDTDVYAAKKISWALGWGYFESPNGRAVFHTGHDFGAQNYTVLFPDRGIGVVLLGNSDNFESMARDLVKVTIGDTDSPFDWIGYPHYDPNRDRTPPPDPVAIELPQEQLLKFVGEYAFLEDRRLVIKMQDNKLVMSDDMDKWTTMFAESKLLFFIKEQELKIRFRLDDSNQVSGFDLLVQGIEITGEKIK